MRVVKIAAASYLALGLVWSLTIAVVAFGLGWSVSEAGQTGAFFQSVARIPTWPFDVELRLGVPLIAAFGFWAITVAVVDYVSHEARHT